jgi:hypothetical protein
MRAYADGTNPASSAHAQSTGPPETIEQFLASGRGALGCPPRWRRRRKPDHPRQRRSRYPRRKLRPSANSGGSIRSTRRWHRESVPSFPNSLPGGPGHRVEVVPDGRQIGAKPVGPRAVQIVAHRRKYPRYGVPRQASHRARVVPRPDGERAVAGGPDLAVDLGGQVVAR